MISSTTIAALLLHIFLVQTEGKLNIEGVYDCDVPKEGIPKGFSLKTSFVTGEFNADLQLPFVFDDNIKVKLEYLSYETEIWVKSETTIEVSFCDAIELYGQNLMTKLETLAGAKHNCPYPPGNYSVKDFSAEDSDIDLKITGKIHHLYIFTLYKDGVPFVCKQVEVKQNE